MSKSRQDIQFFKGRTVAFSVNAPGATFGSGAVVWRLSKTPGGVAVLTKTEGAGIVAAGDADCTVTLSNTDTVLDPGVYFHALEQTLAGVVLQIASGRCTIRSSPGM